MRQTGQVWFRSSGSSDRKRSGRRWQWLPLTVICSALSSAALAQSSTDLPTINVEGEGGESPIVGYVATRQTSATKTDTPWIETPQAVTTIGEEQIRDQKPSQFNEILRYAPGIRSETFGYDPRNDWFLIRGFPSQNEAIFLDGLQLFYTSFGSWKLDPFALERLEVIRGPSSVLYGGGSPGGVVNAISKMPPSDPLRYLEAGVNNYGHRYVAFDIGGPSPITTEMGQFLYRLTGRVRGGDTQVDFTKDDGYFIAPALTWKPNSNTTFTLLGQVSRTDTNGLNFLPYEGTVTRAPFGRISTSFFASEPSMDQFRRDQQMIGYQFEHNFSNALTLRQNARYAHVDVRYATMYGLGYITVPPDPVPNPATATLSRGNFLTTADASAITVDTQLEAKFGTGPVSHVVLAGVDLKRYTLDDFQAFGDGSSINVVNPIYTPTLPTTVAPYTDTFVTQRQAGFYLQDQMKFDRLTVVASGRFDTVSTDNDNRIGPSTSRNADKFTGRIGAIYDFDFGLAPYASYSTGFNPVVGTNTVTKQLLEPETARQTEVGLKYQPSGIDGHIAFAWFDLTRANVLTTKPATETSPQLQTQTGEVNSRGFEIEAVYNPLPGLKLLASYTSYDLKVTKDGNPLVVGKDLPATPEQLGSAWFDYTIQTGVLAGFGFGGGVRYVGRSFADNINTKPVPAFTLVDATIHYERDGWRAALNITNLADHVYVASCASMTACYYGDRRRILASLSYKW